MPEFTCQHCGDQYRSYRRQSKFCSRDCKDASQRADVDPSEISRLYWQEWMSQDEVAEKLGTTQKAIHAAMQRHGIPTRVAAKRDQYGENNHQWKGDDASYVAFHKRLNSRFGTPARCEVCGTEDPDLIYDWANLTGAYEDIEDYKRMCRPCHREYDDGRRGGGPGYRDDVTPEIVSSLVEDGYSIADVARELDTSWPTVKKRLDEAAASSEGGDAI